MAKYFLKRIKDFFIVDPLSFDQFDKKVKPGEIYSCEIKRKRNPKFHRKFFAMMKVGYDAWEPCVTYEGVPLNKDFESFRKDVQIMAGYHLIQPTLGGEYKIVAMSISFDSMEQDEFEELYSMCAQVLLDNVLKNYTRNDLDRVVNQLLAF